MNNADPLAQLKDIHLPAPIGWWPLAPGWYCLAIGLLLLLLAVVYYFYRRHQWAKPKKQALYLLQQYEQAYVTDQNAQLAAQRISELLKRVALVYYPRAEVANLSGEAWLLFLTQHAKKVNFSASQALLLETPYRPNQQVDIAPLITQARAWIKQRTVPCLN